MGSQQKMKRRKVDAIPRLYLTACLKRICRFGRGIRFHVFGSVKFCFEEKGSVGVGSVWLTFPFGGGVRFHRFGSVYFFFERWGGRFIRFGLGKFSGRGAARRVSFCFGRLFLGEGFGSIGSVGRIILGGRFWFDRFGRGTVSDGEKHEAPSLQYSFRQSS